MHKYLMISRPACPWILQARPIIPVYILFYTWLSTCSRREASIVDTFAPEIGREACLIDRLTLSLRGYVRAKMFGWSFVETVIYAFSTNIYSNYRESRGKEYIWSIRSVVHKFFHISFFLKFDLKEFKFSIGKGI